MTTLATPTLCSRERQDRLGSRLVPLMGTPHLERILATIPEGGRVLEWGLGGSTLYFAKRLPRGASLLSIDHHAAWAERVRAALCEEAPAAAVEVRCVPATGPLGPGNTEAEEDPAHFQNFIHAPDGEKFDVILVDGWARSACMRHTPAILKPGGTVFLHDAQRAWYDQGKASLTEHGCLGSCPEYPGPMLWWGAPDEPAATHATDDPGAYPLIVSFYTLGTPYEDEVKHLRESCERLGLDHDIRGLQAQGSWVANCAMKAQVISEAWYRHRRPVLWVDADGVLKRRPALLAGAACDFAIHKRGGGGFRSGTVYFAQTPLAEELLGRWYRTCKEQPMVWDQISLDLEWEAMVRDRPLETLWLPASYCKVTGENTACEPVIEQGLASLRHATAPGGQVKLPQLPHPTVITARLAGRPRTGDELAQASHATGGAPTRQVTTLMNELRDAHDRLKQQRDHRLAALRQVDHLRWRLLDRLAERLAAAGASRIAIYGAGRHTELLTREPWASRGIRVVAILDDAPRVGRLRGVPVLKPADFTLHVDAVVVSSDAHEPALIAAASRHFGDRVPVHAIYGQPPEGWSASALAEAQARRRDLADARPAGCTIVDLGMSPDPSAAVARAIQDATPGEVLFVAPLASGSAAASSRQTFTRSTLGLLIDRAFAQRTYLGQLIASEPRTHVYPPGIYDLENFDAPAPDVLLVLCREPIRPASNVG